MKKSVLIVVLALLIMPLFAQKTSDVLKVKGEAILSYTPEEMKIVVSIVVKDSVYANCSDKLIRIYNSVVNGLIAAKIDKEKIKSGSINLSENTRWVSNEQRNVKEGYVGRQSITIIEMYSNEQLTKIVDALKTDTLYFSYTISFQLSEKQKNEALKLVIEGAIKDAKNKAQIIANATNIRLVRIKDINYNHTSSYSNDLSVAYCVVEDYEDKTSSFGLTPLPIEIKKSIDIIWVVKEGR